jgi:predicted RNA polymerase sigma factor
VAKSHVHGPTAALALIGTLDAGTRLAHSHRLDAVRAHLLELVGDRAGAKAAYEKAARATTDRPEQHYLRLRAANLSTVEQRPLFL